MEVTIPLAIVRKRIFLRPLNIREGGRLGRLCLCRHDDANGFGGVQFRRWQLRQPKARRARQRRDKEQRSHQRFFRVPFFLCSCPLLSGVPLCTDTGGEACLDELIQITIQNAVGISLFNIGAQILHHLVGMQHI